MLVILPAEVFALRPEGERYKISVCDWMILKRQKIGEFALAREIGCDGIEVDMGGLGKRDTFDNKLRYPHFQKLFREKAQENKVEISYTAPRRDRSAESPAARRGGPPDEHEGHR